MNNTEVILELDTGSLENIQSLAKEKGKTVPEEAVYLLEKGIEIADSHEIRKNEETV